MPYIPLTQNDIIFAVAGAVILFTVYKLLSGFIRLIITREIRFSPDQLSNVLENCYRTFPIESLDFDGIKACVDAVTPFANSEGMGEDIGKILEYVLMGDYDDAKDAIGLILENSQ